MGSVMGAQLKAGGNDVTLIDVAREALDAINSRGLIVQDKTGTQQTVPIRATDKPAEVGPVDLILVFVKCYHTEAAVRNAAPLMGPDTMVLSLQNGWGNGPRIGAIVGEEKLLLGVCYHSATVLGPGHVLHAGKGMTFIGELNGSMTERLQSLAATFQKANIDVTATAHVLKEIWSKLALNVATLPTSATLRITAERLLDTPDMQQLMHGLLREVVAVAQAQKIPLDFNERWEAITGLLKKLAPNTKGSMLQDVENRRRTEIDVINGAIVEASRRFGIPTPYNDAMVWMVKALEKSL